MNDRICVICGAVIPGDWANHHQLYCSPTCRKEGTRRIAAKRREKQRRHEANLDIFRELEQRLLLAEEKHPTFAEGPYQALGYVGEEYSEVVRALTKNEGDERLHDELMDLVVVCWRFLRGDHRVPGDEEAGE